MKMFVSLVMLFLWASWCNSVQSSYPADCGRITMSTGLSPADKKLIDKFETVRKTNSKQSENACSSPDLSLEIILSIMEATTSKEPIFPWMVAIYGDNEHWCSGALIDRLHVLTAYECLLSGGEEVKPSQLTVKVGNLEAYSGISFPVAKIKSHEDFVEQWFYNNIAILTLESEILSPLISPICLPDETTATMNLTGKPLTLIGWDTPDDSSENLALDIFNQTLLSHAKCREHFGKTVVTTLHAGENADIICSESPEGGYDECDGHSGEPLMYRNNYLNLPDNHPDNPWVLVGIGSFCNKRNNHQAFARISAYIDWIQKNT